MGAGNSKEKRIAAAKEFIENELSKHKVVVFSKSYCPYCKMAKNALSEIGTDYHVVEIEDRDDCAAIQDALHRMTGGRTVRINLFLLTHIMSVLVQNNLIHFSPMHIVHGHKMG